MDGKNSDILNLQKTIDLLGTARDHISTSIACADYGEVPICKLQRALETTEECVIRLRTVFESLGPLGNLSVPEKKAAAPSLNYSGRIETTEHGWLHLELFTLLPSCRVKTPRYLTDTITWLLQSYQQGGHELPFFRTAMLVIDEHCDLENRMVYDQDNKGWKAIPNCLKGIVFEDDDQFNLGICLLATRDSTPRCHIYVMDETDIGEFFSYRACDYFTPF